MRPIGYLAALGVLLAAQPAAASAFFFSTGNPDGNMAAVSRPASTGVFEIETGDDFVLTQATQITGATFTGLIRDPNGNASVGGVDVEIYRIFPLDSNVGRTSGPPTFSTSQVPTRVNSPSDVAFDSRDSGAAQLTFTPSTIGSFTAANSVDVGGIHPQPNQFTGGNGPASGTEELFTVNFTTPFDLAAGHYFFVPQVDMTNGGTFFWLSAPKPIVAPGTAFPAGFTDLQAWTRDANLDPDWLRIGTDITHQGPFNMAFSLTGNTVPEPATWAVMLVGFGLLGAALRRRARPQPA